MEEDTIYSELLTIILKQLANKCLNHAYLIETSSNSLEAAKEMAKTILFDGKNEEQKAEIEKQINENIYVDLKIVVTEKQWIQKEQILKIQEEFKNKSIHNDRRIYIIDEVEKLNKYAANTILKFLEEPNENIIAILTTKNIYSVIPTITSRCQIIRLKNKNNTEAKIENKEIVQKMATILEKYKVAAIAHIGEIPELLEMDREKLSIFFQNMLYFYEDTLNSLLNIPLKYYEEEFDFVEEIARQNTIHEINLKIQAFDFCIDKLKYNTNIKMLLDKLILLCNGK